MRKLIATLAAAAIAIPLAVQFLRILRPAQAREVEAACKALQPSPAPKAFGQLPAPMRDFKAQDFTGNMVSLEAYRGQVVFLNFWATWCPPCEREMPSMDALQRELAGEGFTILALASNVDWKTVRDFFHDGTAMTILLDPPPKEEGGEDGSLGAIAKSYGIPALPETFLIDKQGNLRYYFVNKRDWHSDVAITCIRSLLDE